MRTRIIPVCALRWGVLCTALAFAIPLCTHTAQAVNILTNATFTGTATAQATFIPLDDPDVVTSDGWRLTSDGIIGLLSPEVTLDGIGASISGFSVDALNVGLVGGEIAQVTGISFVSGQLYRASIDITTPSLLSLGLLASNGSGIGLAITSGNFGNQIVVAST
jgi:hypothetical protein